MDEVGGVDEGREMEVDWVEKIKENERAVAF